MILRKPYAIFIKIFKPIHFFMAVLVVFLIYDTNKILSFFNECIYTNNNVVGNFTKEELVSNVIFIIPIILIMFSLIFLGIMFSKKKKVGFYVINTFVFLAVIVINIYCANFLSVMQESIVSIKSIKFNHDLIFINMIIEVIVFILLTIRGLGINFKKFNFNSDITKLNISDADKEEFELNVNIDLDVAKRKRKKRLRYFKYIYKENKMIINLSIVAVILISTITIAFLVFSKDKMVGEGEIYNINNFNLRVNKTMLLQENFSGKKLTDNYLVVIDLSLQSSFSSVSLFLKDFSLQIDDEYFYSITKYNNDFLDLGVVYNNNILSKEYDNYLLIFELPENYLNKNMVLVFNDVGVKRKIKLNPKKIVTNEISNTKKIGEEISFEESLGKISFTINSFEIKKSFLVNYNYCIKNQDYCVSSKEYIKPSINENFDKIILKLNVDYNDESNLKTKKFYNFFSIFGDIYYKQGEKWYSQNDKFEELKSKKVKSGKNVYIGIDSSIMNSDSIKLVFNIRNSKYEYILK